MKRSTSQGQERESINR